MQAQGIGFISLGPDSKKRQPRTSLGPSLRVWSVPSTQHLQAGIPFRTRHWSRHSRCTNLEDPSQRQGAMKSRPAAP